MLTLLLLHACAGDKGSPSPAASLISCEQDLSTTMTILPRVQLGFDQPVPSRVSYRIEGVLETSTPTVEAAEARHPLLGAYAGATVAWTAWADLGEGEVEVCAGEATAGELPAGLADLRVDQALDEGAEGPELVLAAIGPTFGGSSFAAVFDRQGRIRWYVRGTDEMLLIDVQEALDGGGVLYNLFDGGFQEDIGRIVRVDWEGEPVEEIMTSLAHHMFVQLPDGRLAWQVLDVREVEDPGTGEVEEVAGDAFVVREADGSVTTIATVWDWPGFEPDLDQAGLSLYPGLVDWTHGNALKYLADRDLWLLSMANVNTVALVDPATGQPVALYGELGMPVAGDGIALGHQHDPSLLDDETLLLFSSRTSPPGSGAVRYRIDEGAGELVQEWSYGFGDGSYTPILGQAIALEGDRVLVNFGAGGAMHLVEPDGSASWKVRAPTGLSFRQARVIDPFWAE